MLPVFTASFASDHGCNVFQFFQDLLVGAGVGADERWLKFCDGLHIGALTQTAVGDAVKVVLRAEGISDELRNEFSAFGCCDTDGEDTECEQVVQLPGIQGNNTILRIRTSRGRF